MLANPGSKMTFQNANEFKEVVSAGALIRQPIKGILKEVKSKTHHNRLVKTMRAALTTDSVSLRGERTLQNADLSDLKGYNFNESALLDSCLLAPHISNFDAVAATNTIAIDAFVPVESLKAPAGATHFKIITAASEINFIEATNETSIEETEMTPIDENVFSGINHVHALRGKTDKKVLSFIAVKYYQYLNGEYNIMKNNEFNAMSIVDVNEIKKKHGVINGIYLRANEIPLNVSHNIISISKNELEESSSNISRHDLEMSCKLSCLQSENALSQSDDCL